MPFVVIYDASVLYPNTLRDLLLRVAQAGLVQARWTEEILDEMFAALKRDRPQLDPVKLDRTRALMGTAVRDWKVTGYEPLVDALKLPDPDDRHVLAAAIRARAQVIVTSNLRDFPAADLDQWDIEAKSPDEFMRDQVSLDRAAVYAAAQQIADSWRNPPGGVDDVLDRLERSGLAVTVAELRAGR
jgi:predicted nucleic acid-binding protein